MSLSIALRPKPLYDDYFSSVQVLLENNGAYVLTCFLACQRLRRGGPVGDLIPDERIGLLGQMQEELQKKRFGGSRDYQNQS
jgi:hypothetical protein